MFLYLSVKEIQRNARRKRIHEERMQRMRNENAERARLADAAAQNRKQEHKRRMEQMQIDAAENDKKLRISQKEKNLEILTSDINQLTSDINRVAKELEQSKKSFAKTDKEWEKQQQFIDNFDNYKQVELDKVSADLQLQTAKEKFENADKQIKEAINKTGQDEPSVGRFLKLTHGLLGATMTTTQHSNKLEAEISTFGELVSRECQDKLSIAQYFGDTSLEQFIPILAQQDFKNVASLRCKNEEEYKQIVSVIEEGIRKLKLAQKSNDDDGKNEEEEDGGEPGKKLLGEWGWGNYWQAMVDYGCTDPNDWKDLTDDDLEAMGFKKFHIRKFHEKTTQRNSLMSMQQMRLLKETCLEPETWEEYEKQQANAAKEGLAVISPLLSEFFKRIHQGIKQSQAMLNYEANLNGDQLKAIEKINSIPPKSIEYKPKMDNDDNDEKKDEDEPGAETESLADEMRKQLKVGSKCELYSVSSKKWMSGEIVSITEDEDGEWLQVKYGNQTKQIGRYSDVIRPAMDSDNKLALQSRALTEASIVSIDVTTSMMDKFNESTLSTRALTVATGVEDCCVQIVKSQGMIRQSVLLSQEILKMKPSHMSNEAKALWEVVDNGIFRIIKTAVNMVRVSSQYFGFFLRFKQSFQFYQSNADKSLMVSLRDLKKDVREFAAFQENFSKTVEALTDEAMNCIRECVKSHIGADVFEKARSSRECLLNDWLNKKKIYDKKAVDLDHERDEKEKELINIFAEKAGLQHKVERLERSLEDSEDQRKSCIATKKVIMELD